MIANSPAAVTAEFSSSSRPVWPGDSRCAAIPDPITSAARNALPRNSAVDSADAVDAEQARLAEAGLAAVEERDTTCCYARQDKFWVKGAPGGERWEIYTVLADSATFWGQDDGRSWAAAETELNADPGTRAVQCCGDPQAAGADEPAAASGACCG
jgi:hypothetical protein